MEHFNKVCKYEREREKQKMNQSQSCSPERSNYANSRNLVFTKTLEPLVNYMIKRRKAIERRETSNKRPNSPRTMQKEITMKIVRELAKAAGEIREDGKGDRNR